MWSCDLIGFVVSPALVTVCMCISAAFKKTKKLMDTLPHEPEKIDFWFFGTVEHLSKQRCVVLRQYSFLVSNLAEVLGQYSTLGIRLAVLWGHYSVCARKLANVLLSQKHSLWEDSKENWLSDPRRAECLLASY